MFAPTLVNKYGGEFFLAAFTFLLGDMNPANDTMGFQMVTVSNYWEILADLPVQSSGHYAATIYDGTGRLVKILVNRAHEPAGTKTVFWNAKDDESRTVANGVYFVRLEAEGKEDTYKMILVK